MEISLRLTKVFAQLNNGKKNAVYSLKDDSNMKDLIDRLEADMPGIKKDLLEDSMEILDSINIYINGENIRYLKGVETLLSNGDQVGIIPAAAAG